MKKSAVTFSPFLYIISGIIIGFFIGKTTTSKNTVKKYNQCFSYDFGDEEEKEEA